MNALFNYTEYRTLVIYLNKSNPSQQYVNHRRLSKSISFNKFLNMGAVVAVTQRLINRCTS